MASSTVLKFSLEVEALGPEMFHVLEFTLTEAMSECFLLQVHANCLEADIPYADMIGKDAILTVASDYGSFSGNVDGFYAGYGTSNGGWADTYITYTGGNS